uniref:Uncharacterized protein n=1 Tax=Nelumbo nucifera TaxID=4432 RepID=A0A822YP37_NELNU|nr:TPA_asm: hypothetical protein HUJ06_011940 [Nelumbo nucifera]
MEECSVFSSFLSRMTSSSSSSVVLERRGIPGTAFVEDVQAYLTQSGLDLNSSPCISS